MTLVGSHLKLRIESLYYTYTLYIIMYTVHFLVTFFKLKLECVQYLCSTGNSWTLWKDSYIKYLQLPILYNYIRPVPPHTPFNIFNRMRCWQLSVTTQYWTGDMTGGRVKGGGHFGGISILVHWLPSNYLFSRNWNFSKEIILIVWVSVFWIICWF